MATLPENWEWDYDGARWFYRFKPTGLVQYTFPKPGDEFPEFVDDSFATDLAPEEKLVSQQQIRRRSTLGESSAKQSVAKRGERAASNAISDPDDGGGPFWLQPDGLMYMGPGAYTDISPLQEEEEEEQRALEINTGGEAKGDTDVTPPEPPLTLNNPGPETCAGRSVMAATETDANQGAPQPMLSQISPPASAETTPLVTNTLPATATPELDGAVVVQTGDDTAVDFAHNPPPEIPLLDSREVPYDPLGVVAELPSELTARCDEEINPAPVELPSNEIMLEAASELPAYANAFHLAPAELASDEIPAGRRKKGNGAEQKVLLSENPVQDQFQERQQRREAHQAVQELGRPYRPVRQNSMPQSGSAVTTPPDHSAAPEPGKFQPYNPAKRAILGAAAGNRSFMVETPVSGQGGGTKRHSLAGPPPSHFRPSDVPTVLQPPHVARPLNFTGNGPQTMVPGSGTFIENDSGASGKQGTGALAHVPSVLQPARGRPVIRAQSPPQSQGASPGRTYQAYKPIRDLQRDIEDTVQLLSRAGFSQETATPSEVPSDSGRPKASGSSTIPGQTPALPRLGASRPQLPQSSASMPVTLRGLHPHQAAEDGPSTSDAPDQGAITTSLQDYSIPLPSSSPDLPQPLNLSRKSPPPQSSVPTAIPLTAPMKVAPEGLPTMTALTPSGTTTVTAQAIGSSSRLESNPQNGSPGSLRKSKMAESGSGIGRGEPRGQLKSSESESGRASDQIIHPSDKQQLSDPAKPEHAGSSGFSVISAPAIPDVSPAVPSGHPTPAKPATSAEAAFTVEVPDAPILLHNDMRTSLTPEIDPAYGGTIVSMPSQAEVQVIVSEQRTGPLATQADQERRDQSSSTRPRDTPRPHVVSLPHATGHVQDTAPAQSPPSLLADWAGSSRAANPTGNVHTPPESAEQLGHQPPSGEKARGAQQAAATPATSDIPRQSSPQTPSPLSRASSPPSRQADAVRNIQSVPPSAVTGTALATHAMSPTGQPRLGQEDVRSAAGGLGASLPSTAAEAIAQATTTAPSSALQTGRHPVAPQPVSVCQTGAEYGFPGQLPFSTASTQPAATPLLHGPGQSDAGTKEPGGVSSQQPSQVAAAPAPSEQPLQYQAAGPRPFARVSHPFQGQASPQASMVEDAQSAKAPFVPQRIPVAGQVRASPGGTADAATTQAQPPSLSNDSTQTPPSMPPRTLSLPVTLQPGQPPHPGAPGTAPPQMAMVFPPPALHPGVPAQVVQPGILPLQPHQLRYPFQPGAVPPAGMRQQPTAPQMTQPRPLPAGTHVMQPAQPSQPAKEERGWFGRLWKSDSEKRANNPSGAGSPANSSNKLQKGTRPQAPSMFPSTLHPTESVPAPQLAAPVPPVQAYHTMTMAHAGQQGRAPQGVHHQQQQQQQEQVPSAQFQVPPQVKEQQALAWKTIGNDANSGSQMKAASPQFRVPTRPGDSSPNPSRSVLPPPEVRQVIQQQEQRLTHAHATGMGIGQGAQFHPAQNLGRKEGAQAQSQTPGHAQGQAIQRDAHTQGRGEEPGKREGDTAASSAAAAAPTAPPTGGNAGSSRWGSGNASGYDGSGWGDEEEDYS